MPDFRAVIQDAYQDILRRGADDAGLSVYHRLMNEGMTEAAMRESLLRSPEYARKNPELELARRIGLNVHLPSTAILTDVAENLGVAWIRVDFDWFRIEPERGRFVWNDFDRVVQRSWELGLEILATLFLHAVMGLLAPGRAPGERSSGIGGVVAQHRAGVRRTEPKPDTSLAVLERAQSPRVLGWHHA